MRIGFIFVRFNQLGFEEDEIVVRASSLQEAENLARRYESEYPISGMNYVGIAL